MKQKIKQLIPYSLVVLAITLPWFFKSGYLFFTEFVGGPKVILDWRSGWFLFDAVIVGLSYILPMGY